MAEPTYYGDYVQIGTGRMGIKPLARKGKVVIVDGHLQLFGGHDELIDQAPVGQVVMEDSKISMGTGFYLRLDDRRYSLCIGGGKIWLRLVGFIPVLVVTNGNRKKFATALANEQQQRAGGLGTVG